MKIETTPREDHQVTMHVEVETEQMESAKRRAARKIAQNTKIPGFRPGKAPYDVVRRHYGDQAITEEAVEILVEEIYPQALKEANIEPGAMGTLSNIEGTDNPKFTFVVPLAPAVELGDYKSLRKTYEFTAPDAEKINEQLEELRRMYATTETVERELQEGDFTMVDIAATVGDEAIEDLSRTGMPIFIRPEERDNEWPYAGFSKELVGLKAGESKTISHKFPKEAENELVQGKTVNFDTTVKIVRGTKMPELDDDFAKTVGAENLEDLRAKVAENLESQEKSNYDDMYFTELFEQLKEISVIKYAPQSLDHETEHVVEDLKRRISNQRLDFDTYLKTREMDEATFTEQEAKPIARKRLERSLLIDEIVRQEKIEIEPDKLEDAFQQNWAALATGDEQFAKLTKNGTKASKELIDAVVMDTANRMMVSRVLDRMKAIATGQAEVAAPATEAPAENTKSEEKPKAKKTSKKSAQKEE